MPPGCVGIHHDRGPATDRGPVDLVYAEVYVLHGDRVGGAVELLAIRVEVAVIVAVGRIARTLSDHIIVKNFDEYEREGAGRYSLRREDRDALDRHLGR
jgi:hypothetical protein